MFVICLILYALWWAKGRQREDHFCIQSKSGTHISSIVDVHSPTECPCHEGSKSPIIASCNQDVLLQVLPIPGDPEGL